VQTVQIKYIKTLKVKLQFTLIRKYLKYKITEKNITTQTQKKEKKEETTKNKQKTQHKKMIEMNTGKISPY
jgi:hypothetical protein